EDQLLGRRGAPAAVLGRPRDPGVAGVEQAPLPAGVVGPLGRPVLERRLGRQRGQGGVEPGPQLAPDSRLLGCLLQLQPDPCKRPRCTLATSLRGSASTISNRTGTL